MIELMQPMMQKSPKKAITHQGRPLFDAEIAQKGDYASGQTVIRCRNRNNRLANPSFKDLLARNNSQ